MVSADGICKSHFIVSNFAAPQGFRSGIKTTTTMPTTTTTLSTTTITFSDSDDDYYGYQDEYNYGYDDHLDESDCSIYANALKEIEELEEKKCSEFSNDGYRCVPFQACKDGEIVTSGAG